MANDYQISQQSPYYGGQPQYGYVNKPTARFTQPLTDQQINQLRSEEDKLSIRVDEKDIWRAQCTHKHNGSSTLTKIPVYDDAGNVVGEKYRCSICGAEFNFFEGSVHDVEVAVGAVKDILQTCKTINLDAPPDLVSAYYQFIPLLDKLPLMWDRSVRNYQRYANDTPMVNPMGGTYIPNNWGMLNAMTAIPYYGQQPLQAYQQPMPQPGYGMPLQQPQGYYPQPQQQMMAPGYYQQPMVQPGYVMPQQNPFVAPAPGMAPQPAPAVAPQPAAAPAPAPATEGEVTQNKAFTL